MTPVPMFAKGSVVVFQRTQNNKGARQTKAVGSGHIQTTLRSVLFLLVLSEFYMFFHIRNVTLLTSDINNLQSHTVLTGKY